MSESIHRHITAGYAVSIEFTKQGRRQFARSTVPWAAVTFAHLSSSATLRSTSPRMRRRVCIWTPSVRSCATMAASTCCFGRFRAHGSSRTCSARKRPSPLPRCIFGRAQARLQLLLTRPDHRLALSDEIRGRKVGGRMSRKQIGINTGKEQLPTAQRSGGAPDLQKHRGLRRSHLLFCAVQCDA